MSNTNWKKMRLLLALALASAPLANAASAAIKMVPTGLNHDSSIMRNFARIGGASRLIFYNPTTDTTRAVGTDGKTQYNLVNGSWQQSEFPADMSGYFAISTSGRALSDQQVDALVKAGDLASLADHSITAELAAANPEHTAAIALTPAEIKAIADMRKEAIAQGNIFVAGLSADGKLVKNAGITADKLQGTEWKEVDATTGIYQLPGGIKKVSINGLSHVWGINEANEVVFKASLDGKDDWEHVPGLRTQIIVNNKDNVWSLGTKGEMFIRLGISNVDPNGSGWAQIPGWAINLAINDNNMVYHIGGNGIYFRKGVTDANPAGTDWVQIKTPAEEPKLKQISINNQNQLWALGATTGTAYVLAGITAENPAGTGWMAIDGKLKQITATNNGAWCIDESNKVFFRENVSETKPAGTGWAGPFPHNLTYIFASGARIAEPKLNPAHQAIKDKQANHRLVKMQHRLEGLKAKEAKAQGPEKEKLTKAIAALEKRIAKMSKSDAVSADVAATTGKKAAKGTAAKTGKKKHKKAAAGTATTAKKGKKNHKKNKKNKKAAVGAAATTTPAAGATATAKTGKKKHKKNKKNKKNKAATTATPAAGTTATPAVAKAA